MKAVVVYDTFYGNTKEVAQAIADEAAARGCEAEVRSVRKHYGLPPQGDIMFVGAPVRCGTVSHKAKSFVKRLDEAEWKDKPLVVFTTTLALPETATQEQRESQDKYDRGAGRKLRDLARERGLQAREECLWVEVQGMRGPLVEDGVDKARRFASEVLRSTGLA